MDVRAPAATIALNSTDLEDVKDSCSRKGAKAAEFFVIEPRRRHDIVIPADAGIQRLFATGL